MKIKRLLIILALLFVSVNFAASQDFSNLYEIQLKDSTNCRANDGLALQCANYLLSTPITAKDANDLGATRFLIRWMTDTPDYSFDIDKSASKLGAPLLGRYFAAMTKFALENKDKAKDKDEMKYNSFLILIQYCENADNKVNQNKEVKNLIKAKNDNKLKEYLEIQ